MKIGDLVMIYIDPVTEKEPEGWASVVEILKDSYSFYRCNVQFLGENGIVYRRILKH